MFTNIAKVTQLSVKPLVTLPSASMSFKKIGKVEGTVAKSQPKKQTAETVNRGSRPLLSKLIRGLYIRVHPDHFAMYPEQQKINEQSMMTLQGFLDAIKNPKATEKMTYVKNECLDFYLRGDQPGHFRKSQLVLHYTGGPKEIVYTSLNRFFKQIGLADGFVWDPEFWPRKILTQQDKDELKARAQAEKGQEEASNTTGVNPNESYEEFQERLKREAEARM